MIRKIEVPTPFSVGTVNAFILKGDALSIVDVGPRTDEAYEAIVLALKKQGYKPNDIEQVILTHHHVDHAGWVDGFDRAEVIGHAYNELWLKRNIPFEQYHNQFYIDHFYEAGVPEEWADKAKKVDSSYVYLGQSELHMKLQEGDELPGHPGWQVYEMLGHAQSHLLFYHERTQTAIGGDVLLLNSASNPLIEPPLHFPGERPKSLLQYNESLKRLYDMPVQMLYTGHGAEIIDHRALIDERFSKRHERAMKVLQMLTAKPQTIFEVTKQLFSHAYEKHIRLTLSETLGQLDYLESLGAIKKTMNDGCAYYEAI